MGVPTEWVVVKFETIQAKPRPADRTNGKGR